MTMTQPPVGNSRSVRIRRYRQSDAHALTVLYRRSVELLGTWQYTPEQVRAWASLTPTPEQLDSRMADGRMSLVAVDETDAPLAFTDLESNGHIGYFYAAPIAAGTGVADMLYDVLEASARRMEVNRLHTEASEAARRFFLKQGFSEIKRRDFTIGSVAIHNYAMSKSCSRSRNRKAAPKGGL